MIPELQTISTKDTAELLGVEFRSSGSGRWVGLCPFHQESIPSRMVYPDNSYFCFSCKKGGRDAADFVKEIYSCSFPEALKILGIRQQNKDQNYYQKIQRLKEKRRLENEFKNWIKKARQEVQDLIRPTRWLLGKIRTEWCLDKYGKLYQDLETWIYHEGILAGNDNELIWKLRAAELYADYEGD